MSHGQGTEMLLNTSNNNPSSPFPSFFFFKQLFQNNEEGKHGNIQEMNFHATDSTNHDLVFHHSLLCTNTLQDVVACSDIHTRHAHTKGLPLSLRRRDTNIPIYTQIFSMSKRL